MVLQPTQTATFVHFREVGTRDSCKSAVVLRHNRARSFAVINESNFTEVVRVDQTAHKPAISLLVILDRLSNYCPVLLVDFAMASGNNVHLDIVFRLVFFAKQEHTGVVALRNDDVLRHAQLHLHFVDKLVQIGFFVVSCAHGGSANT